MEKSMDNYLINMLEDGRNLNIVLLSHNAYWPEIEKLDKIYENCNVTVFGGSTSFIKLADVERRTKIENSDLIIFYSSDFYDESELEELKEIAFEISNDKNKRVSIGYLYSIPTEQRPNKSVSSEIEIISFKNSEEIIEKDYPTPYFTTRDLIELTLVTVDDYDFENQHQLQKKI